MANRPPAVHHLLFAAFPVLFLYSHNIGALSLKVLPAPLIVSVCSAAAFFLLLNLYVKNGEKTALVISLFLLAFFSYGRSLALFTVLAAIFVAGSYMLVRTRRDLAGPTYLCNTMAAILVLISMANICRYEAGRAIRHGGNAAPVDALTAAPAREARAGRPDIYYIVVDAYAGDDILREVYGYDNSGFTSYLESKGFYVASEAVSNYSRTGLSLASSLNMEYLDTPLAEIDRFSNDMMPLAEIVKQNRVFDFLRRRGYTIAALESGCAESGMDSADIYLKPGWAPDEFGNMLIGTTPIPLLLRILGTPDQYDAHADRILFEFRRLADTSMLRRPLFIFAHIAVPHPPFVFGPDGQRLKPGLIFHVEDGDSLIRKGRLTKERYIRGYVDQLIFTNMKLRKVIDAILSGSKRPAIIILQSDHGPRSMLSWKDPSKTNFRECMSILNAYRLPDGGDKLLYKGMTPVNTFRAVFDYYFGTDYGLLEDRSYFSDEKYPYKFVDVTPSLLKTTIPKGGRVSDRE